MSRIFGYVGKDDCRSELIDQLSIIGAKMDCTSLSVKLTDSLACVCGNDFSSVMDIDDTCRVGLCEASLSSRAEHRIACSDKITVALDGEIDNFFALRLGYNNPDCIETDEELLLTLFSSQNGDAVDAMMSVDKVIDCNLTYALFFADENAIYCKKGNGPLFVGVAKSGYYIASEISYLNEKALRYFALSDGEYARLTRDKAIVYDSKKRRVKHTLFPIPTIVEQSLYLPNDEIFYLPLAIKSVVNQFVNREKLSIPFLKITRRFVDKLSRIIITGEGSAYYSAIMGANSFNVLSDVPTYAISSGELMTAPIVLDKYTLLIALSDSGEDMPTIACVKRAKNVGAKTIAITDYESSYLALLSDVVINPSGDFDSSSNDLRYFVSSYLALSFLALDFGIHTDIVNEVYSSVVLQMADSLSGKVSYSTKSMPQIQSCANMLSMAEKIIVTGYLGDKALAQEGRSKLLKIADIESIFCQLDEIENAFGKAVDGALIVAFISDKRYLSHILLRLRRLRQIGAKVLIYTATNIEDEIVDFDTIVAVNDSVPLLNPVPIIASFYKTVIVANDNSSALKMAE